MTVSADTVDKLVVRAKEIAAGADDVLRRKLIGTLRDLSISLEKPEESVERICYTPLELCVARVADDLKLFTLISASEASFSLERLAEETKADPVLLGRLMRYLASVKMVDEVDSDVFAANNVTRAMSTPKGQSYIRVYFELVSPAAFKMPSFFAKTNYANPTNPLQVPFQQAFGFEGDMFAFYRAFPKYGDMFDTHMTFQRDASTDFLGVFDVMQQQKRLSADGITFVDLGGGIGHQCARLKEKCPNLPGRIILQDLPQVLEHALPTEGIEKIPCDMFNAQPIEGARFYYIRGVLHDFPDKECRDILRNVSKSMTDNSLLLIDEMVLPDKGIHWQATSMDMQMLSYLGSQERTQTQWTQLVEPVGLRIIDIHTHRPTAYESLIVVTRA